MQSIASELKLALDLVPASSFCKNLRSELTKAQWDALRRSVYAKSHYKCDVCGGVGSRHPVECHESWSYVVAEGVHIQRLVRLLSLCPACHLVKHMGRAAVVGRREEAIQHFCKVNGMSRSDAMPYLVKEFDVWSARSTVKWALDLSWLSTQGSVLPKKITANDRSFNLFNHTEREMAKKKKPAKRKIKSEKPELPTRDEVTAYFRSFMSEKDAIDVKVNSLMEEHGIKDLIREKDSLNLKMKELADSIGVHRNSILKDIVAEDVRREESLRKVSGMPTMKPALINKDVKKKKKKKKAKRGD